MTLRPIAPRFFVAAIAAVMLLGFDTAARTLERPAELSKTAPADMTMAEAQKELATITAAYNREGQLIKQMALGTLLRFYPRKIVPCGALVITLRTCLEQEWTDLKDYPGHFLGPDAAVASMPTVAQARMTEDNYFDAIERLNMLLRAVRYESILSPDTRYREQLRGVIERINELHAAEARNAALYEKLFKIGGVLLLLLALSVGGMLAVKHLAHRAESSSGKDKK